MSKTAHLPRADYEPADASPKAVLFAALAVIGLTAGSLFVSAWIYHRWYLDEPAGPPRQGRWTEHAPQEKSGIEQAWAEQDRQAAERLHDYGWIDRENGVVRIPIERAMERMATEAAPSKQEERP